MIELVDEELSTVIGAAWGQDYSWSPARAAPRKPSGGLSENSFPQSTAQIIRSN